MNSVAPPKPLGPSVAARRLAWRLGRLWDHASIYLPVLLMGLMALGSYWLLQATPEASSAKAARPVTHEPDYFMRRFSVKVFDADGVLKTEVYGAEARHRPDNRTVEIDQARIRSVQPNGLLTTATAQQVTSNAAQTNFVLEGDAVVVREAGRTPDGTVLPRLEFRSQRLQVFTEPQRLMSDRTVTLVRGNDRIKADLLDYRGNDRVLLFSGRVKAHLSPR